VIIAYGKLGRSVNYDPSLPSTIGGDIDVARTLHRLASARPDDTFLVIGKNGNGDLADLGYPPNVRNIWAEEAMREVKIGQYEELTPYVLEHVGEEIDNLGAFIIWAGQHGTSNTAGGLPTVKDPNVQTNPQHSNIVYCGYLLYAINRWRDHDPLGREEIWLCPDPRNYIKCRDNRWPLHGSIIAQYDQKRNTRHERFGDERTPAALGFGDIAEVDEASPGMWLAKAHYTYDALELTALAHPNKIPFDLNGPRHELGLIVNENRAYVARDRLSLLQDWVLQAWPDVPIWGKWSDNAQEKIGRTIEPVPYRKMLGTTRTLRTTISFPASGSFWATAKPWEAFASGTICFFHPDYDRQGWILSDAPDELREFLRVNTANVFRDRVYEVGRDVALYRRLANLQRAHFERRWKETKGGTKSILDRLIAVP